MRKLLLLTLCAAFFAFGCSRLAHTQPDDARALNELRVALDQIAQGRTASARLLLEAEARRAPLSPEAAFVLAHLQEREGDAPRARTTLERSATQTTLTRTFAWRILNPPTRVATAPTIPQNTQIPSAPRDGRATLSQGDARLIKLEQQLFELVNAERAREGLRALVWNEELASVSRAHSAEMRDKSYFGHESPVADLKDPLDRFRVGIGTSPRLIAENVYRAWGGRSFLTEADIREANRALMNSPGHRSNILLEGATSGGVGIVTNSQGEIWVTQMFAKF